MNIRGAIFFIVFLKYLADLTLARVRLLQRRSCRRGGGFRSTDDLTGQVKHS